MSEQMMKAARLYKIGDFRVDEVPVPVPHGDELLVKIGACGLCGSDLPRIYQHGTSSHRYPLTIGHEFAGVIEAVGETADPELVGRRGAFFPLIPCRRCESCLSEHYAMCEDYDYMGSRRDGGFAEYCLVPSAWHFVESKNSALSYRALSMVEPACVAQHAALRKSGMFAGACMVIFGAGPIGIMAGRWARIGGAAGVLLVDVAKEKCEFARTKGFESFDSTTGPVEEAVRACFHGRLADIVVEGTGYGSALEGAICCVKSRGTIVLLGNPAEDTTISLQAHSMLLRKEIAIQGIWNSHFGGSPINEWSYTVDMMDRGLFQCEDLISHAVTLEELPGLVEAVKTHQISICKAVYDAGIDS